MTDSPVPGAITLNPAGLATLAAAHLTFSPEVVANYLLALQTKRFVLLTGISGTGKTQLALAAAEDAGTVEGAVGEARERAADAKRVDLYKMHTYRDAIRGARSVWILYPGTESRYFPLDGALPADAFTAGARPLEGVGAIPLRPEGAGRDALERWVSAVLGGAGPSEFSLPR